ncbi:hypothetical protein, partial [Yoonia sp.]|uniref:hypothetical protein n=1 Tax=Yoonia sp. TaxID=2212373 RepID=UPI003A4DBC68
MNDFPSVLWRTQQAVSVPVADSVVDVIAALPLGKDGQIARLYLGALPEKTLLNPDGTGGVVWSRMLHDSAHFTSFIVHLGQFTDQALIA